MTDTPDTPPAETPAEALKRVLAAKKAAAGGAGGKGKAAFKPGQHPERSVTAQNAAKAKPAFRKASKRG